MVRTKAFSFDEIFDEDIIAERRAAEDARQRAEEDAAANAPPTYTVEELEEARASALAQGRQEGMADAMASIEQQVSVTVDGLFGKLGQLFQEHNAWREGIQRDSITLATSIMRRLAPDLVRGTELPQIERVINDAFQFLTEQPKVIVRVAAELEEPFRDKVHLMATRVGYEGEVVLVGDPELEATDCRISWSAGAVERSLDETWQRIDELVERTVSSLPGRQASEAEPEDARPLFGGPAAEETATDEPGDAMMADDLMDDDLTEDEADARREGTPHAAAENGDGNV